MLIWIYIHVQICWVCCLLSICSLKSLVLSLHEAVICCFKCMWSKILLSLFWSVSLVIIVHSVVKLFYVGNQFHMFILWHLFWYEWLPVLPWFCFSIYQAMPYGLLKCWVSKWLVELRCWVQTCFWDFSISMPGLWVLSACLALGNTDSAVVDHACFYYEHNC